MTEISDVEVRRYEEALDLAETCAMAAQEAAFAALKQHGRINLSQPLPLELVAAQAGARTTAYVFTVLANGGRFDSADGLSPLAITAAAEAFFLGLEQGEDMDGAFEAAAITLEAGRESRSDR